jgi:drug/metabolite transporter (DMT)-like permease
MTWFFVALLSSFLSAFAAIIQKKVLFNLKPLAFSFILSIVNLVFSIPFFFFINYNALNSENLFFLFGKSVIGALAFLCVMNALKNLQISNALPLLALTPGFVAIFAFLILGEGLKHYEIIGLISLMVGTYILESKSLKEFLVPFSVFIKSRYHHFIIAALLLFTASSIMDKILLIKLDMTPVSLTAFQHIFFALLFGIIFIFTKKGRSIEDFSTIKNNLSWIVLISLLTIGYRFTQVWAVSLASVALTLAVKRTSVLWATIIGGKIFKDTNLIKKIIAVIFILIGAILILNNQ